MAKKHINYMFIILLVVIFLGVFFRFAYLDLARFEHEMVRDLIISDPIAEGNLVIHGSLPWLTSERQNTLGPLLYYLTALGTLFSGTYSRPFAPLVVVGILDLLAVLFSYKLGKEFFGKTVGVLVALFYLLAPWHILNTTTVFTPTSFLPLFVVLFCYSLFKLVIHHKDLYIIPVIVLLSLQLQFHLTPFILLFTLVPVFLLLKRNINIKYLGIGCFLALLVFSPFLYHSLTNDSLFLTYYFLLNRDPSDFATATLESLGIPILFITPYVGEYTLGEGVSLFANPLFNYYFLFITALFVLLFILSILYLFYLLYTYLSLKFASKKTFFSSLLYSLDHNDTVRKYVLLLLLFFAPIVMYSFKASNLAPHYLLIVFPLPILMLGIFLSYLLKQWRVPVLTLIAVLLVSNVAYIYSFDRFVDEHGGTKGVYGIPYRDKMQVVDYIIKDSPDDLQLVYYKDKKPLIESFNYLFTLNGQAFNHTVIEHIEEFEHGYLILDRYSFYKSFGGTLIPEEDHEVIDAMNPMHFNHLEVIKKA